jgi:O-antigen ligase
MNNLSGKIDKAIRILFYILFLVTPLVMTPFSFELFEFPKMWLTFVIALVVFFLWATKAILLGKLEIRRTPLDLPLLLFLAAYILSTIFSIDPHTSLWGYYSRFNGGLFSIIAYIFLYYAFVSNVLAKGSLVNIKPFLLASLVSGAVVALWGLPSHFGYDPTCALFRGKFDVSCWTAAFQPKVRIFSTLGQPNWLAAYLALLIPIALAFVVFEKRAFLRAIFASLSLLFYLDLIYTDSRSGMLGVWIAILTFYLLVFGISVYKTKNASRLKPLLITLSGFLLLNFFIGQPIEQLNKFTYKGIVERLKKAEKTKPTQTQPQISLQPLGGTDSGKIRRIVWEGALKIFQTHPLLGTGPETFAFAYYKARPVAHNLTSEWDYLYNKAHNEYLNYLATTGIVGFGSYMAVIVWFLFSLAKNIKASAKNLTNALLQKKGDNRELLEITVLSSAFLASYLSILIINFFGFSVVVVNLYFFLIPAFVFALFGQTKALILDVPLPSFRFAKETAISGVFIVVSYLIALLFIFFLADEKYALGKNYDSVGMYQLAYPYLVEAVKLRPGEYLFKDELSSNLAVLAALLAQNQQSTQAAIFENQAKNLSDEVVSHHPNNVVYYKTRTKVFYLLSQINPSYLSEALNSIKKAQTLAPTDAKIAYNRGLIEWQLQDIEAAKNSLRNAIVLKPDYRDPRFALAQLLLEEEKKEKDEVKREKLRQEAKQELSYILEKIATDDAASKDLLKSIR